MKLFYTLALTLFFLASSYAQSSIDWSGLNTVEDVCRAYPERMNDFIQQLDLDRKELIKVKHAYQHGKLAAACKHLLNYYKTGNTANYLRRETPKETEASVPAADTMSQGVFTFYNQKEEVPRKPDGRFDWDYAGPADDIEWAWALNRHIFMKTLLQAYLDTGNTRYAETLDGYIKDWVVSSLPYPRKKSSTAMWRGLEVSFRVKSWAAVFYGLMDSEAFSPATRILLLSSIPEHAHYLREFHARGNWLTMELSALARGATAWPEFKEAEEWLTYAREVMTESLLEQIYPDGVQTELTAHYHRVALVNFDLFRQIFQEAEVALPTVYTEKIEQMWNYLAYSLRPNGTNPLNNDSDLRNYQETISQAAKDFKRPDWDYIATNGQSGGIPESPSTLFPYAGQAVFRSGWDQDAQWAFFDIGPWGSGHQHNDKLHLSIAAYGRDLLVDGGRFAYRGAFADKFRPYARGSASHNVMLIDGQGQGPGPKVTEEALESSHFKTTKTFDAAWGSFNQFHGVAGKATHTRSITYVRDQFWVVVDQLKTDRPRQVDVLWHWHPDCVVGMEKKGIVSSQNTKGNLAVMPIGKQKWKLELVKGQEKPQPQGWYSVEYNKGVPNTASIYTTRGQDGDVFVWLLVPSEKEIPKIKAKIISQTANGLKVQVKSRAGKWDLFVPFRDSQLADSQFKP